MHARDLIDLAAVVAAQGPKLIRDGRSIPRDAINDYWTAAKSRLDRWGRILREIKDRQGLWATGIPPARRPLVAGLLEEIITGEMLARVWAATLCYYDRLAGNADAEPVARSVLLGQMEIRNRVLTLLANSNLIDKAWSQRLNRLRRRVERWIDALVGHLIVFGDVSEFAVDPKNAEEFADDLREQPQRGVGEPAWSLLITSLRSAFGDSLSETSPNADLNNDIARSVVDALGRDFFRSVDLFPDLCNTQGPHSAEETLEFLEELLADGA